MLLRVILSLVVALNGVYDIACAIQLLLFPGLYELHISMFESEDDRENSVVHKLMASWMFTYGCIRLWQVSPTLIAVSYLIEAAAFHSLMDRIYRWNGMFVCYTSLAMAMASYLAL